MALSVFDDKTKIPEERKLAKELGRASTHWEALKSHLSSTYDTVTEEWVYSGKQWGWALRLKQKKRAIVYLTPCEGFFYAGFTLGEKAVKAARQCDLPVSVMNIVDSAKKYAEGRAVRIEVRSAKTVGVTKKLISIKMAN